MSTNARRLPPRERSGFAARFHEALGDQTTEGFAREFGVTLRTAQRWRNGQGEPSAMGLLRLARHMDRDPRWFYPSEEETAA